MKKTIHEKNFSFTSKNKDTTSTLKSKEKVKIANKENIHFISDEDIKKKEKIIKIIDSIILILNIGTNIAFLFFIGDLLNGFSYASGIGYNFTTTRTIGIVLFVIAQITGIYLTVKLFLKQNLKIRLILTSVPLTFIFVGGLWLLYNINSIQITDSLSASRVLGISENATISIDFKYILIGIAIYIVILYFLYGLIFKQSKATKVSKKTIKK